MSDEAMRAAFEADAGPMGFDMRRQEIAVPEPWAEYVDLDTGHRWAGWQAATLAEREHFAIIWERDAAQAAIDYANGHLVNWTAGADKIRKGETP